MKKIGVYLITVLIITIILPSVIVKTFSFVPRGQVVGQGFAETYDNIKKDGNIAAKNESKFIVNKPFDSISLFNPYTKTVSKIPLEEYVKGVVAAEMPAEFHIEALKAQAVAARTYAASRMLKYSEGHPDHPLSPLCKGDHCQVYLSKEELKEIKGEDWIVNYWSKIEEAVNSTKGMMMYYGEEIIEPLYHSTSGGMTEDAINVFQSDTPYLKSVLSPYEEEAPRYKTVTTISGDDFINKINNKFPEAKITKDNFSEKIRLIERTKSGRISKLSVNKTIIEGRELRDLFNLNSTNFTITYDKNLNIIDIVTYGFGHGVGMSQWGANGMAKKGSNYVNILKHYYTGIDIR